MRRIALLLLALMLAVSCQEPTQPDSQLGTTQPSFDDDNDRRSVVHVAAPTGDVATDVANIRAAVAAATPGATIEFARGTYKLESATVPASQIVVSVAGVTLEGHRRGTTIQGISGPAGFFAGYFRLAGGRQTVRRLEFAGFRRALTIGAPGTSIGGYHVEHSTFRNGHIPISFVAFSDEVSTIRGNQFINVTQPFLIRGKTVHFRENRVTAPDPAATPFGQPFNAGVVLVEFFSGINICENNVLEENTIVGNADGFILFGEEGEICRNNVIRENRFIGQRIFTPGDNGTMVWLVGPNVQGTLIKENELDGSEGLGIVVEAASDNKIIENEFSDLPGEKETFTPYPGTAIFLGEPTSGNRVLENEFEDVVNEIVDLGTGNVIGDEDDDDDEGDDDEDGDHSIAGRSAPPLAAEGSRMLDHSKLGVLRERLKN
jgi:parallel beta-helix repeat protein